MTCRGISRSRRLLNAHAKQTGYKLLHIGGLYFATSIRQRRCRILRLESEPRWRKRTFKRAQPRFTTRSARIVVFAVIVPFNEVASDYAQAGGEWDGTLENWREHYWNWIVMECQKLGCDPVPNIPMICDRFMLIYSQPLSL